MAVNVWTTQSVRILFGYMLIMGLVFTSVPLLMPNMQMERDSIADMHTEGTISSASAGEHQPSMPCCDNAISQCVMVLCAFVVPQTESIALHGGSQKVNSPLLIIQSVFLHTIGPPPKA